MKELNLPASFDAWNWQKDDDTIKAYYAVSNKGYTRDFKVSVWNALCEKLKSVLDAMDLSWDSKYTSYLGVLLSGYYPTFTARIFNSVRHNIEVHVPTTWKWQFDKTYEGFVGRVDMRSRNGNVEPDILYGSYILEIARKLNLLISIFKNTANFKEPQVRFTVKTDTSETVLSSLDSALLNVDLINVTDIDSDLSYVEPIELTVDAINYQDEEAILKLRNAADTFVARVSNHLSVQAVMLLEDLYRNLYAYIFGKTEFNAKLTAKEKVHRLTANATFHQSAEAKLIFPDLVEIMVDIAYHHTEDAHLINVEPLKVYIDMLYKMQNDAKLEYTIPRPIQGYAESESFGTGFMELFEGSDMYAITSSVLKLQKTVLDKVGVAKAVSRIYANASITPTRAYSRHGIAVTDVPVEARCEIESDAHSFPVKVVVNEKIDAMLTFEDAVANAFISTKAASDVASILSIEATAESKKIKQAVCDLEMLCEIESDAHPFRARPMESNNTARAIIQRSRLEGYKEDFAIAVDYMISAGSDVTLDALYYEHGCLICDYILRSVYSAIIDNIRPFALSIDHIETEVFDVQPELRDAKDTMKIHEVAFGDSFIANLEAVRFMPLDAFLAANTSISSDVSFDAGSWHNPVLEDDVLSIYQVYDTVQEGETIKLDCEEDV